MGDVTDRMASAPSGRARLVDRQGSNLGQGATNPTFAPGSVELKEILRKVEPLPGSQRFTAKEVEEVLQSTMRMVGETSVDWNKRLTMLKTFRSLCCDQTHHVQIVTSLRQLLPPMEKAVTDLRSQVGREACITVAYITYQLGLRSECFAEPLLPSLFKQLVANAKVVSMTSCATIFIVYESVPSWRLIPTLQTQMWSKSKEVRRAVCEVLKIILNCWPMPTLLKHANLLHEIVKKGLTDADSEARAATREAFPAFQTTFPGFASSILDTLDPLQRRQLSQATNTMLISRKEISKSPQGTNGSAQFASLTRQGSMKKTNIPVLASRIATPVKTPPSQARSSSAIDLQAANRAKQHHFSTMRTPLRYFGRTSSMSTAANSTSATPPIYKPSGPSSLSYNQQKPATAGGTGTAERSRTRSRISRLSHSQPGSRSNSPSSKYISPTYSPHHTSSNSDNSPCIPTPHPYGSRGIRRPSATSSASSSRDTSPQGRIVGLGKSRSRSVSNSPQILSLVNHDGVTAKMLLASREAESALADALMRRDVSEVDYGNHSDSEDSMGSHRSYLSSETFSPPATGRHLFIEDNVEELLNKCGSAKWSERKEGLLGLQNYLTRHGSIPSQHFNRIGQTFCRIFMDAHTKVLSLFLDVLHAVLYRHARDLVDFTTILLNRILTKLGSDLLTSVHTKLMKTLDIIMDEMPPELQFSAVTHYLCDPTQTPNSKSRIAALSHVHNLSSVSISVRQPELQQLVDKILDWCVDMRSQELRRISQKVFYSLFGMAAPQMTLVLSHMSAVKQDQAKAILKNIEAQEASHLSSIQTNIDEGAWSSINSNIQSLRITPCSGEGDLVEVVSQMLVSHGSKKGPLLAQLYLIIKDAPDAKLIEHHKDLLKVIFDALSDVGKPSDKACCFYCLEEMCNRPALNQILAAFAELFLVRVTDVQTPTMPREVTKAAENCGMAVATNFPPEIIARALCPIVHSKDFPVNQLAIKMIQRLCDSCELSKLRAVMSDIINTLIAAYDHPDSAVRKAAVFAIVAVHCRLGSELEPYLAALSGSKLKLLQLYIQRAQQSAS